jgi:folate-binding protein YgfZ
VLGEGQDLVTTPAGTARIESMMMNEQFTQVGGEALEVWRIRRGVARFPIDLTEGSVPAEAGLDALIDTGKGCFLGQESVAKIRNPRPPRARGSSPSVGCRGPRRHRGPGGRRRRGPDHQRGPRPGGRERRSWPG